ncbi:hypothetical protein PVK06_021058 [Gossypium arboreum]|uniref:C2 NT-type domain-containing protein n=1 Tax=Gossypium arboreum TaxID=29729 RepID=A0ABR0PP00_GOSAR|nr:hypothetical protein PVK06_021058 [Gossypium arboreum]
MRVLSIKYRFCALVDPMTYDSFDIKGGRSLKAIVQIHLASGSPYLELYVQLSLPNEAFATSTSIAVREEHTTSTRHSVSRRQNTEAPMFGGSMEYTTPARQSWLAIHIDSRRYETSTRRDDVLSTMSTGEGTLYVADHGGLDDESNVDPPREPGLDSVEVVLFSEPRLIPTEPKDGEGGSDEEKEDLRFRERRHRPTPYRQCVTIETTYGFV